MPIKTRTDPEGTTVSVVIPAYQAAGHIREALNSVLSQTFQDHEILVVNDGSPDSDALEDTLKPYRDKIHYIKQPNRGPGGARNAGILAARGTYVAFLDSDDVWHPNHLSSLMEVLLADPTVGLVYSDCLLIKAGITKGTNFEHEPQSPKVSFRSLLMEDSAIVTSSALVSRQAILDVGMFDESLRRCEDFHLWLRLAHHGVRMSYVTEATLSHVVANGLSADSYLMARARVDVYHKILASLPVEQADVAIIQALIRRGNADCELYKVRESLEKKEYASALDSAKRAAVLLDDWKVHLAVIGLRRFPNTLRRLNRGRQRLMSAYHRLRRSKAPRGIVPSPANVAKAALVSVTNREQGGRDDKLGSQIPEH